MNAPAANEEKAEPLNESGEDQESEGELHLQAPQNAGNSEPVHQAELQEQEDPQESSILLKPAEDQTAPQTAPQPSVPSVAVTIAEAEEESILSDLFWKLHSFRPESVVLTCGLGLLLYIVALCWALSSPPHWASRSDSLVALRS